MAVSNKRSGLTISLSDESKMAKLRTVLSYESTVRGLTIGQVFTELVYAAIDLDSYPPEVLAQLADTRNETRELAIARAAEVA